MSPVPTLRARGLCWAGAVSVVVVGLHALEPAVPREPPAIGGPTRAGGPAIAAATPTGRKEPALELSTTVLGRRTTLGAALERLALDADLIPVVTDALAGRLDLRRLPAETGIAVARDPRSATRIVGVRAEPERFVRLLFDRGALAPRTELVDLAVTTDVVSTAGRVLTSVDRAIAHATHAARLTLAFADVFQWDVDLLVEPRAGDVVRIVYESRRFGELPADLPPFAGRIESAGDPAALGRILAASYEGSVARSTAYWVAGEDGRGDYYDTDGVPLRKTFLKSPLNFRRISSGFSGARLHPVTRKVVPHHGVDFAAAAGTPVAAAADGRVASAGWEGPLGRAIRVRHGGEYVTVYGHLSRFAPGIRAGVEVRQNDVIGYVGSTGRATGPHLHYTLIERGRPVDPLRFDNPPSEPLPAALRPRLAEAMRVFAPQLAAAAASGPELASALPHRASLPAGS